VSIRVLLADDQALVRSGFRVLLERTDDVEVVGEASTGIEALKAVRLHHPEIALMDIRMPGLDGLEATRRIASDPDLGAVRVIMLTTFDNDEYVFDALRAGASGFLLKDVEPEDLRAAIRAVAGGEALLSPSVTRRLISEFVSQPAPDRHAPAELEELTEREREVLALVAAGLSNAEIAARLVISPATAKTHVSRILLKLGARDRAQLVVIAYETGLVTARSSSGGPSVNPAGR
jgi:DNA-binding NarL/FixJ family response regulator